MSQSHFYPLLAAILALSTSKLPAQTVGGGVEILHSHEGLNAYDYMGAAADGIGDVDQDGVPDYAVGVPGFDHGGTTVRGKVDIYSGATGALLDTLNDGAPSSFGERLAGIGDVDLDGVDDLLIAGTYRDSSSGLEDAGRVYVYSGATRVLLHQVEGSRAHGEFGRHLVATEDIDQDGAADFLVGVPQSLGVPGHVQAYSGATGNLIHDIVPPAGTRSYGKIFTSPGDVDGDGAADLMIYGSLAGSFSEPYQPKIHIYSGATGQLIQEHSPPSAASEYVIVLSVCGDYDGDGRDDLLWTEHLSESPLARIVSGVTGSTLFELNPVGGSAFPFFGIEKAADIDGDGSNDFILNGSVMEPETTGYEVYSGLDGTLLYRQYAELGDSWGNVARGIGDLDGDGRSEVLFTVLFHHSASAIFVGQAQVHGWDPYLESSHSELSSATGGSVSFQLDFPLTQAGQSYRILASHHGSGPSMIGGLQIPLTQSGHLWDVFTLAQAPAWFTGGEGLLNTSGQALASFTAPAGRLSSMVGLTVHFAAVTWDSSQGLQSSSAAVPLEILP